jgi:phosphoribosyl 1,2-cyclic phosphate phosphodiesterase
MSIKFTILGCGSSMGVPRADGYWGNCDSGNKKNYRTRCSALISTKGMKILFDTSPDLRSQLIREKVKFIDKIFYSHPHADQTHGINDLRIFYLKQKKKIEVYTNFFTKKYLKKNFSYCFNNKDNYPAILKFKKLNKTNIFSNQGKKITIRSIEVKHGLINCLAFIINKRCAYASDVNRIHKNDYKYFYNLKYFIVDCLRFSPHSSHFHLDQVLKLVEKINPKKTILTNLHSDLDYNYLLKILPKNVKPAYDGLSFYI